MLEQTKGSVKLTGKVKGIGAENAFKHEISKASKQPYRKLQFFIETAPDEAIKVELLGATKKEVVFFSNKGGEKKQKKVKWAERHKSQGEFVMLGVQVKVETQEDGKLVQRNLQEFDACEIIHNSLKDGDSVTINAQLVPQTYTNAQGEKVTRVNYVIKSIYKLDKEVDFDAEGFEQKNDFKQEIVISEVFDNPDDDNEVLVDAKLITYDGKVHDVQFTVDKTLTPKLAENFKKRLGLGDFIEVYGKVINKVVTEQVEEANDEDDWGSDSSAKGSFTQARTYINKLVISAVESTTLEKGKYTEDELIVEDEDDKFESAVKENSSAIEDDGDEDMDFE